jgi:hypothetical protein
MSLFAQVSTSSLSSILGDPLLHKYVSMSLSGAGIIENAVMFLSQMIPLIIKASTPGATFTLGEILMYVGNLIYSGLQMPINAGLLTLNYFVDPLTNSMSFYSILFGSLSTFYSVISWGVLVFAPFFYSLFWDFAAFGSANEIDIARNFFFNLVSLIINGSAAADTFILGIDL